MQLYRPEDYLTGGSLLMEYDEQVTSANHLLFIIRCVCVCEADLKTWLGPVLSVLLFFDPEVSQIPREIKNYCHYYC